MCCAMEQLVCHKFIHSSNWALKNAFLSPKSRHHAVCWITDLLNNKTWLKDTDASNPLKLELLEL